MTAVFDTNILICFLQPDPPSRTERVSERVEYLLRRLDEDGASVVIPTPVLAELPLYADADERAVRAELHRIPRVEFGPFNEVAAVELARVERELQSAKISRSEFIGSRSKLKFDKLIVAIALGYDAPMLYTDDDDLAKISKRIGIRVTSSSQLPIPPEKQQQGFELLTTE